jgi:nicotinamidase-related amidase
MAECNQFQLPANLAPNTVLLLIDVQEGFSSPYWGVRNNPQAEENMLCLLSAWRQARMPVIHVQHLSLEEMSPLNPKNGGHNFKSGFAPEEGEVVFQKQVNSAFIGTSLEAHLRKHNYETLVIAGLTTDHCVSTSTRMAGNFGFTVYLVGEATACFDRAGADSKLIAAQSIFEAHLASLHGEFATVCNTKEILACLPVLSK